MVQLAPPDRVKIAKEVDHVWVPTPPQIAGQGQAFVVQCLVFTVPSTGRPGGVISVQLARAIFGEGLTPVSVWLIWGFPQEHDRFRGRSSDKKSSVNQRRTLLASY